MATWRAMRSLEVLFGQVDEIAPGRSKASDGLKGDPAHAARDSDHNPHFVPGVGDEIVTAGDLTHDPAHGFDSYRFAEVLRLARDRRIKYVISNGREFASYSTPTRRAWTWAKYTGSDPHTNHVHISVVENGLADTRDPWNLEGFDAMTPAQQYVQHVMNYRLDALRGMKVVYTIPAFTATDGSRYPAIVDEKNLLAAALVQQGVRLGEIDAELDALPAGGAPAAGPTAQEIAQATAEELTDREAEADRARAAALESAE